MKTLIGVINCHTRPLYQQTIRETWLALIPKDKADVRFFLGRGATREPRHDEVFLDVGDLYGDLPEKCQAVFKWAYENGYDFALKCDDDVVLKPKELLESRFEQFDFTGHLEPACEKNEIQTPWGFCYWLSRRAMELIIKAPLPGQPGSMWGSYHGNDEAFCASVLHWNGIYLHNDPRYVLVRGLRVEKVIATHRPLRRPALMEKEPIPGAFAWCPYLNYNGWHQTPDEENLKEFRRIFQENS